MSGAPRKLLGPPLTEPSFSAEFCASSGFSLSSALRRAFPSLPWSFSDALEPGGQGQMQSLRLSQHPCRQPPIEGSGAGRQIKAPVPGYQWATLEVIVYASQKVLENQYPCLLYILFFSSLCHSACSLIRDSWALLSHKLSCLRLCF